MAISPITHYNFLKNFIYKRCTNSKNPKLLLIVLHHSFITIESNLDGCSFSKGNALDELHYSNMLFQGNVS